LDVGAVVYNLFLVACNLQMHEAKAVAKHSHLDKRLHGRGSKRILPGCSPLTSSRG